MSLEGVEWYLLNSFRFIRVVPLGMVVWSSVIILCIRSLFSNLSVVVGFRPCSICASCIHAVSSEDGFSKKLFIVLFRWTPALCLSMNNVRVIGDLTQWWYLMPVISLEPPYLANMNCIRPA